MTKPVSLGRNTCAQCAGAVEIVATKRAVQALSTEHQFADVDCTACGAKYIGWVSSGIVDLSYRSTQSAVPGPEDIDYQRVANQRRIAKRARSLKAEANHRAAVSLGLATEPPPYDPHVPSNWQVWAFSKLYALAWRLPHEGRARALVRRFANWVFYLGYPTTPALPG